MSSSKSLFWKKISIICLLVVSLTFFVGCADINYRRIYSSTGTIIDEVYIALDKDVFASSGQAETLYGTIKSDVDSYSNAVNAWIVDNFGGKYVDDISVEDFIRNGIKVEITNMTATDTQYTFSFFISFASIEHFVYFYGLNTPEVIESYRLDNFEGVTGFDIADFSEFFSDYVTGDYMIDESKLFTNDYVWSSDNAYENFSLVNKQESMTYIDYYCSRVNSILGQAYTEQEIMDNINITQCFETDDKRINSNADSTYIDPELGYYIHVWNLNSDAERDIEIMRSRPVSVWWYVLAIVITGICIAIMFVIAKKRKVDTIIDDEEMDNEREQQ